MFCMQREITVVLVDVKYENVGQFIKKKYASHGGRIYAVIS